MAWRIDDRLWVSGQPSLRTLAETGATAVLTVSPKLPRSEVIHAEQVAWWRHEPLSDGKRLNPEAYQRACDVTLAMLDAGHTVLVHCMAGRNRSALVAALVLVETRGLSGAEAVTWLREHRPRSLANEHHLAWLLEVEPL